MTFSTWVSGIIFLAWPIIFCWVISEVEAWRYRIRLLLGCLSCTYMIFVVFSFSQLNYAVRIDRYVGFLYSIANESEKGNDSIVKKSLSAYLNEANKFDDRLACALKTLEQVKSINKITKPVANHDIEKQQNIQNDKQTK